LAPQAESHLAVEVDAGFHEHAAERAPVDRAGTQRKHLAARPPDLHLRHHRPVEIVAAAHGRVRDLEIQVGLVLGHAPDALAALHRNLGADWQVEHVLTETAGLAEEHGTHQRYGPWPMGAADAEAVFDVF